jgi:IS5 family transposase
MARLKAGAEAMISMAFLVMCAEKVLRLLRLFFVFISVWVYGALRLWITAVGPGKLLKTAF